jgi:predicted RNA-binding Zn ribbon-like protein
LVLLNARLRRSPQLRELGASEAGYVWRPAREGAAPELLLGVLAQATAALLTSPELSRLRLCEGAGCGWLFLDLSPNRSRRWCAMASCGNRAKARRHYARRRQAGGAPPGG